MTTDDIDKSSLGGVEMGVGSVPVWSQERREEEKLGILS